MKKIIHISDLHFGDEVPKAVDALLESIKYHEPDLVLVSGDLTQRARSKQYLAASEFLSKIDYPKIVVPGNHDISLWNIFRRFFNPLKKFQKYIDDEEFPAFEDEEMIVIGVNSARSLTIKSGRISTDQIDHLKNKFCGEPNSKFKGVVIHHNLIPSVNLKEHKSLGRVELFVEEMKDCGIDMIFSGHLHEGYSGDIKEFHKDSNSIIVVQAGTAASARIRKENNSFNLIEIYSDKIKIIIYGFDGESFSSLKMKEWQRPL